MRATVIGSFAGLLVLTLALGSRAARAQDDSSVDSIINSLKPGAGMTTGTRGIRPVAPEAGTAPDASGAPPGAAHAARMRSGKNAAAVGQAAPADDAAAAPSKSLHVEFASGSAVLTSSAIQTLGNLGQALTDKTLASYRFRIEGHTDTVGNPEANKALAEQRAQAVVTFVITRYHVDPSRLEATGLGEEGLAVPTPPQTPEARNRRVEIINLGT